MSRTQFNAVQHLYSRLSIRGIPAAAASVGAATAARLRRGPGRAWETRAAPPTRGSRLREGHDAARRRARLPAHDDPVLADTLADVLHSSGRP